MLGNSSNKHSKVLPKRGFLTLVFVRLGFSIKTKPSAIAGKCFIALDTLAEPCWCSKSYTENLRNSWPISTIARWSVFKLSLGLIFIKQCPHMEEYEPIWELQVPVRVRDVLADTTWYSAFPLPKGHQVALSSGSLRCLNESPAGLGWERMIPNSGVQWSDKMRAE